MQGPGAIKTRSREGFLPAPARLTSDHSYSPLRYRSMTIFLVAVKPFVSIL